MYRKSIAQLLEVQSKTTATNYNAHLRNIGNRRMGELLKVLLQSVDKLEYEFKEIPQLQTNYSIPPVLCHMDLQPQNMILGRRIGLSHVAGEKDDEMPSILSVLDWEETCYADPRFELLLLCRKVLANRKQADKLWEYYSNVMQERYNLDKCFFGPLEPWLKLETVHSVITLCLQEMDLQKGGRNPWERSRDLWFKISRELRRLVNLGWEFCDGIDGINGDVMMIPYERD